MSDQFYNEMAAVVVEMLAEFGTDATITRTNPDGSVATFTIRLCFTDPVTYRIRPVELDQPAIRFVADAQVAVQEQDRLIHPRGEWVLTRVDPIQPASVVMGYRGEGMKG